VLRKSAWLQPPSGPREGCDEIGMRATFRRRADPGGPYDVKGNLWAATARLGGIVQIDPRGIIRGFVPVPNGDPSTTNFAFGGPDNRDIFLGGTSASNLTTESH
jgi:sugar lactone lactonase YvrE